jgi:uncharacterized protein YndB with AHSA1/START domain
MLGSMVVTVDRVIEAPPALVFEIYTDPDRFPEWQPAVRGLIDASGQPDTPGATYVLDQPGPRLRVRVLAVDPPRLHEQQEGFRLFAWVLTVRFLEVAGGTRVVFEYRHGSGPRWLWGLVMRFLAFTFGRAELAMLKQAAERHASEPFR